ncbi:hypothetical protein OESDEN_04042 [Oesophagostomum dentatum]|uniref:Uncharacterized protein n=1 Tax=Oesophagostomum dentatum TaxID=61180 RepID=A0A0B1TKQ5_OESDE|nr:hypothetical protein OESDEN_04042 [Oesophagostomum dentatum]
MGRRRGGGGYSYLAVRPATNALPRKRQKTPIMLLTWFGLACMQIRHQILFGSGLMAAAWTLPNGDEVCLITGEATSTACSEEGLASQASVNHSSHVACRGTQRI